ncbi:MAG: tetratricopeptide repeat protein [Chthoniobacteraceae bacterium]
MTVHQAFKLAVQQHQAGRLAEAESLYRQILAVAPQHADALHSLGLIAYQVGRNDIAVDLIGQALALAPTVAEYHSNLGLVLTSKGEPDEAIAAFHRALELKPDVASIHNNLGNAFKDRGDFDKAIASYRHAIQLEPNYVEANSNLGAALAQRGQLEEAIACCKRALHLRPEYAEAHNNLGTALQWKGQVDEAITAFQRALNLKPNYATAHINLSNAHEKLGQLDESIRSCLRAIELDPRYAEAHSNLGVLYTHQARFDEAMESYRRAALLKPRNSLYHSNLIYTALFHPGYNSRRIREENARWQETHGTPLGKCIQPHANSPDSQRRLKVGYVSPDFWRHVVCHFLVPLLEMHDHSNFEIYCYASVKCPDQITERMRKAADTWRDVLGMRDETLAELIRADEIDILVDLSQHTANNRLPVFARKPAPVQVAWLGYPGSTGLKTIDYRLTDSFMEPEGADWVELVEKVIRLPDSWFCFDPVDEYPAAGPLPALSNGYITFGCLNNFSKINEAVIHRWAEVLRTVEGARLLLRCPGGEASDRLRQSFTARGIEADRVEQIAWTTSRERFLDLFQRIDIALDPFPYNGGTTTCEALWMGVPVLTLPRSLALSRLGFSILSAIGLPELAAGSEAEYISLAARLAGDLPLLVRMRATLRKRMQNSPFMDRPRFARNVELAYREMWRNWCTSQHERPSAGPTP